MPAKVTEAATDYEEIDRWAGGVGWLAHPEETMQRASHALATEDGVWVVDPLDAPGVDDLLAEYGDVAGVVLLSNHHTRDADTLATRHDVPVYLPDRMRGVARNIDAPIGRVAVGGTLGEYELIEVTRKGRLWQEYALYDGETLVVSESISGAPYTRVGDERLGVLLVNRLLPPTRALGDLEPERVLCGHGAGVHEDAATALSEALSQSWQRLPAALLSNGPKQFQTFTAGLLR